VRVSSRCGTRSYTHPITLFLQRCFDACSNGLIYGSLAVALVIVYKSTGLLNVAQGEVSTMATYVGLVLHTPATPALAGTGLAAWLVPGSPLPLWASVIGAVAAGAVLGAVIERVVVRRVASRSRLGVVSMSVGLMLTLNGVTEALWFPVVRGYPPLFPNKASDYRLVGGARLRETTVGTLATVLAVLVVLAFVLRRTKLGLAFRAVASNDENSRLMGIRVGRVTTGGWALAGAIGALAASLVAPTVLLEPSMMVRVLIYALVAATLGGLDSLGGALVGGLLIGVAQTMIAGYVPLLGSELALPVVFALMAVVLMIRPTGLFGRRMVERV
jgi:branched-chain amino acid transport system permease protein